MKYLILLALIISACSEKDKDEGLNINEPIITSQDGRRQGKFNDFKSYNRSQLHSEDTISFKNTTINFKLKATSTCKSDDSNIATQTFTSRSPKEMKIKNLLPFETVDWMSETVKILCDFEFIASDDTGAEHSFVWQKMEVTFSQEQKPMLFTPELNEVSENAVIAYSDFEYFQTLSPDYRKLHLYCDEMKVNDLKSLDIKLNSDQLNLLRDRNFRCRMLEVNKWNGLENFSPVFYISPGSEKLVVQAVNPKKAFSFSDNKHEISSWEIYNPSRVAKNISIESNFSHLDSIYYNIGLDHRGDSSFADAAKTKLTASLSHDKIFMLEPAQSVTIKLYVNRRQRCLGKINGLIVKPLETQSLKLNEYRHAATQSHPSEILQSTDLQLGNEIWVRGIVLRAIYRQKPEKRSAPHLSSAKKVKYLKCR